MDLLERYHQIRSELPSHVTLVAVSKGQSVDKIRALSAVHQDFGENYLKELEEKHSRFPHIRWHFLGRLQSNKIEKILKLADVIHTLCQMRHAEIIARKHQELSLDRPILCFLCVNLGQEPQKAGLSLEEVEDFAQEVQRRFSESIEVLGLMAIPPISMSQEETPHPAFLELAAKARNVGQGQLSLGMSQDYLQAIRVGSTCVRIGSTLFGERRTHP